MNTIERPKFMVRVSCSTYNQVNYIIDAMNGFTMQQTNFPFVCTIVDDASTDGEQEVIRQYLEENFDMEDKSVVRNEENDDYVLSFARHKSNINCYFAVLFLKFNHYSNPVLKSHRFRYISEWHSSSKYIALCEGDDYWTHPKKLQMQYDALEAHPENHICFGCTENMTKDGRLEGTFMPRDISRISSILSLDDFCREQFTIGQWVFHTSSLFYDTMVFDKLNILKKSVLKGFPYGDICIILTGLLIGNGVYINEKMSNYRRQSGGFNSRMKTHPQEAIIIEEKLINGLQNFDRYTEFKYHRHIENRILRSHCLIDYHKEGENGLVFLRPKYWKVARMQGIKTSFFMALQTVIPGPYYYLKKLLKGDKS